jgi:signal transduction histidine kinase
MDPAGLIGIVSIAVAIAMAVQIGRRGEQTDFGRIYLTLLLAIALMSGAVVVQRLVDPRWELALLCAALLGAIAQPALWAYLAARYRRTPWLAGWRAVGLLLIPAALFEGVLLTNGFHHGMIQATPSVAAGPSGWAGPIFWTFVAWAYTCEIVAAALFLGVARRLWAADARQRAALTATAALLLPLAGIVYLAGWVPPPYPLGAASMLAAIMILAGTILRYPLLESVPLAHRDVVDRLQDGVVIANRSDLIVDLNPAAAQLLGLPSTSAPTRALSDVISSVLVAPEADALRHRLRNLRDAGKPLHSELCTRDGRVIDVRADCVRNDAAESVGQYAVLRDRTDERRYGEIVRRTQKLETVGTMAAGIAHEINNPLAFIRANLGQLQRMGVEVERSNGASDSALVEELADLREVAEDALDGIDRIERIVGDMRQLSSAPREGFAPTDVNEVVGEAARLIGLRRGSPVEITTSLAETPPSVLGVSQLLVQGVLNLLVNAHQALQGTEGAQIDLQTHCSGDEVLIRVRDNGPGISDEIRTRIFDPFFTTKAPEEGTGLGLAIVRDIFDDHGGVVEVDCPAEGGTIFTARIPARRV